MVNEDIEGVVCSIMWHLVVKMQIETIVDCCQTLIIIVVLQS